MSRDAGDGLGREDARSMRPKRRRGPAEERVEDVDQDQRQPEVGERSRQEAVVVGRLRARDPSCSAPPATPSGKPMASASSRPRVTSSRVAGKRWDRSVGDRHRRLPGGAEIAAGGLAEIDQELHQDGWSRPSSARSVARLSGVAMGPSIITAGSPGISFTIRKLTSRMPNSCGSDEEEASPDVGEQGHAAPRAAVETAGEAAAACRIGQHLDAGADQREAEDGDGQREAREDGGPPLAGDDVLVTHGDHAAPLRGRRHDAGADEAQRPR